MINALNSVGALYLTPLPPYGTVSNPACPANTRFLSNSELKIPLVHPGRGGGLTDFPYLGDDLFCLKVPETDGT
jgi:hypothetical protein